MKWSRIALVAITLPLVACSGRSDTWASLSAAPQGVTVMGLVKTADGGFAEPSSTARQKDLAAQLKPAAQGWLQDLNSIEARDSFAAACARAVDTDADGVSYRFIPLSKLGADVEEAGARTLKALLPLTPDAPGLGAVSEGPYLMMMAVASRRIDNLLGDCLSLLQKLAPEDTSLVTALRPLAEAQDKEASSRYATSRDTAAAADPSPPSAAPLAVVWFGRDSRPFMIMATPNSAFGSEMKSLRLDDVDPLEICGYDPNTTRERTATACDRLLLAAARQTQGGNDEIPKDVIKAWLLANFQNPVTNFREDGKPALGVHRARAGGGQ